jgi:acetyl/propionyl-CoA carboxylase alpha subunit
MIQRVLIANRGEIALRILRSLHREGREGVVVYSDADAHSPAVREADATFALGPAPARDSYLRIDRLLEAAAATNCDAVHPGYGFLSENPAFADAVRAAGLTFIGPSSEALRVMGDKDQARSAMVKAGVPVLPGATGEEIAADLTGAAARVGFPLLLKAAAGGGGKGMRVVPEASDLAPALAAVKREAASAFGSDAVLLERWLPAARHVEVQILADQHGTTLALYDRDCSTQRRHQKVLEEAPAPNLSDIVRAQLASAAVAAAEAVAYEGAGTVEFLVADDAVFFLEMNTRLQVEHPVTEAITGWDLVAWQLRIAEGAPLPERPPAQGHAIEVRVYAEDPEQGYLPSTGTLTAVRWPSGPGLRVDSGVEEGSEISPYYDPMLAKIIAWGPDRPTALRRLRGALAHCGLEGVKNNLSMLRRLTSAPALAEGPVHTRWLEGEGQDALAPQDPDEGSRWAAALAIAEAHGIAGQTQASPFGTLAGFRLGTPAALTVRVREGESVWARSVPVDGAKDEANLAALRWEGPVLHFSQGGQRLQRVVHWHARDRLSVIHGGETHRFFDETAAQPAQASQGAGDGLITAPMPGLITACPVAEGQAVEAGAVLLILEAMKMEHTLRAPFPGVVTQLAGTAGQQVVEGTTLLVLERLEED